MANGRHGGASAGENTSVNGTTTTIDNRESGGGWRVTVAVAVEVRRSCYTALFLVVLVVALYTVRLAYHRQRTYR